MFCYFQRTLGTNPISLAAPANNGDSFVLDMATTAVALGKVCLSILMYCPNTLSVIRSE